MLNREAQPRTKNQEPRRRRHIRILPGKLVLDMHTEFCQKIPAVIMGIEVAVEQADAQ